MPITETITIINNSGKVISTGKHLVNLWKDAKAAYKDKKDAQKAEKAAISGMKRAQTFNVMPDAHPRGYDDFVYDRNFREYREQDYNRRRSIEDTRSRASATTLRSERSCRSDRRQVRPPLTATNLRTFSETSSMPPSAAPRQYRSPYAETAPRDTQLSRPTLNQSRLTLHSQTLPYQPSTVYSSPAAPGQLAQHYPPSVTEMTPVSTPRQSMLVNRPHSETNLAALGKKKEKKIDMNLAYGECPPDLESRVDLDPNHQNSPELQEQHAKQLMDRIDDLLDEAECVHHSATSIITHLQKNPEQAAAVALTLAELSALLTKMSPAFLSVVKGGAPVVWGLLASPQFLIAAGVAVGVTIVTFGGWKIIKRIKETKADKEAAFAAASADVPPAMPPRPTAGQAGFQYGAAFGGDEFGEVESDMMDEALVLAETQSELSSIDSWRRGIVPFGEDSRADVELMSKETARVIKAQYKRERDQRSTARSSRSEHHSTVQSSRSRRAPSERSGSVRDEVLIENANGDSLVDSIDDEEGLASDDDELGPGDSISHVGTRVTDKTSRSHRSSKSHRSERSHRSHHSSGSRSHRDDLSVPARSSSKSAVSDKKSENGRSKVSASTRPSRLMIEDGSRAPNMTLESVLSGGSSKSKKGDKENLLKKLFRKKEKDEKEKSVVSVMV